MRHVPSTRPPSTYARPAASASTATCPHTRVRREPPRGCERAVGRRAHDTKRRLADDDARARTAAHRRRREALRLSASSLRAAPLHGREGAAADARGG
jgi:hypothetical protein